MAWNMNNLDCFIAQREDIALSEFTVKDQGITIDVQVESGNLVAQI